MKPGCKNTDCWAWKPGRIEDECDDCVDGRFIGAVSEYASTCDNCGEFTHHSSMVADEKTQLGYCEDCAKKLGMTNQKGEGKDEKAR